MLHWSVKRAVGLVDCELLVGEISRVHLCCERFIDKVSQHKITTGVNSDAPLGSHSPPLSKHPHSPPQHTHYCPYLPLIPRQLAVTLTSFFPTHPHLHFISITSFINIHNKSTILTNVLIYQSMFLNNSSIQQIKLYRTTLFYYQSIVLCTHMCFIYIIYPLPGCH